MQLWVYIINQAFTHFSSVLTIDLTLSFFRSVYDWPQPTNMTGAPDMYTIDNAAPTYINFGSNTKSEINGTVVFQPTKI